MGTASAGADYIAQSGTVAIPVGLSSATVTVSVIGDTAAEPNETFQVNLSQAVGATISDGQGVGTIVDDEPHFLTIDDVAVQEGLFGTREFVFTVTLSAASSAPVTVNYGTANGTAAAGSDYNARSGILTFAPGQTTQPISSQGVGTILNDDRR